MGRRLGLGPSHIMLQNGLFFSALATLGCVVNQMEEGMFHVPCSKVSVAHGGQQCLAWNSRLTCADRGALTGAAHSAAVQGVGTCLVAAASYEADIKLGAEIRMEKFCFLQEAFPSGGDLLPSVTLTLGT